MDSKEFDLPPNRRGRNSLKWGKYEDSDVIPMWVADMDFKSPVPILNTVADYQDYGNFGYGKPPAELIDLVVERCNRIYQWDIDGQWIVWLPGMVSALNVTCRALAEESSQAIIQTPIYPPFLTASKNFGLPLTKVPLKLNNSRFTIDYTLLTALETSPGDLFMLCHPHNPVGTSFNRSELDNLNAWINERELYLSSDEIHSDLIVEKDLTHIPPACLNEDIVNRSITLMAPSKTVNIAGFGCSFAIIPDVKLRSLFKKAMRGIVPDPPALGFLLAASAYREGEPWRAHLIDYLRDNRDAAMSILSELPSITPFSPEATYLLWIDARNLPVEDPHKFFEENGVGLSDGRDFDAPGFLRLNLGCSRALLMKALSRMSDAVMRIAKQ